MLYFNSTGCRGKGNYSWCFSALPQHSGNYTCKPSSSTPASIQLFVLGEEMLSSIISPSQYLLNITTICALQTYKTRAEAAIIRSAALVKIYLILMLDFTAFVQMTKLEHWLMEPRGTGASGWVWSASSCWSTCNRIKQHRTPSAVGRILRLWLMILQMCYNIFLPSQKRHLEIKHQLTLCFCPLAGGSEVTPEAHLY